MIAAATTRVLCSVSVLAFLPGALQAQATLSGKVRQSDGNQPLADVEVTLPALSRRTVTQPDGSFAFADLPSGALRMVLRRIGYQPVDTVQHISAAGIVTIELRMTTSAVVLDSIAVTADFERRRVRMAGFERRRQVGIGTYLDRTDLKAKERQSLKTLLGHYGIAEAPPLRSRASSINRGCRAPQLIVDGVRRPSLKDLREFQVQDLEAIEVYTGTARVPLEFEWGDASCGVIVLWTRSG